MHGCFSQMFRPVPSSQKDPIDLRLGYVQIGDSEESPVRLQFGRLSLSYGEGRLLADPEWSNVGRSFDAARMIFHFRKLRVDAFSGISDKININGFVPLRHPASISTDWMVPSTVWFLVPPFSHICSGRWSITSKERLSKPEIWTRRRLVFDGWEACRLGPVRNDRAERWRPNRYPHGQLTWLADTRFRARGIYQDSTASSIAPPEARARRTVFTTRLTFCFPSSHDKFGLSDQFGWANIEHLREGFQYRAWRSTTLGLAYNSFRLANIHDGIYNSSGKLTIASNGHQEYIGHEPDTDFTWIHSRTPVDFTASHVFAGDFLQNSGHGGFNYGVLGITQRF